jgi:3-oxoacyl-[acyl-carrier protein] reductase
VTAPANARAAFVTGAAQGIGAAIARTLHERGTRVALADVDLEAARATAGEIDASGETAVALEVDVRSRDSIEQGFQAAVERFGAVQIVVNNAALTVRRSIWEIEQDEWDSVMEVNLRGVLFGCQVAAPHLREQGWGRIVNMSSMAGQIGGVVAGAHYAASKAGILVLTKIAAKELAADGVTVNAVVPAAISGPAMDSMPADAIANLERTIPVGRVGRPDEVAELVAYLCSDAAGFVTGAALDINGGLSMR